eukprot:2616238-Rhodomonas_salina.4
MLENGADVSMNSASVMLFTTRIRGESYEMASVLLETRLLTVIERRKVLPTPAVIIHRTDVSDDHLLPDIAECPTRAATLDEKVPSAAPVIVMSAPPELGRFDV